MVIRATSLITKMTKAIKIILYINTYILGSIAPASVAGATAVLPVIVEMLPVVDVVAVP